MDRAEIVPQHDIARADLVADAMFRPHDMLAKLADQRRRLSLFHAVDGVGRAGGEDSFAAGDGMDHDERMSGRVGLARRPVGIGLSLALDPRRAAEFVPGDQPRDLLFQGFGQRIVGS